MYLYYNIMGLSRPGGVVIGGRRVRIAIRPKDVYEIAWWYHVR